MIHNKITSPPLPPPTPAPSKRQAAGQVSTCGYVDGNPENPRIANPGYDCQFDTARGLWGFCSTTVTALSDCSLVGFCLDSNSCTTGCGRASNEIGGSTSCPPSQFCSTALLLNDGPDQDYEYIACGTKGGTETLRAAANSVDASTTTSQSSSSLTSLSTSSGSPAESPTPSASNSSSSSSSSNVGAIVGGVVAAVVVICITILGVLLIRRKQGKAGKAGSNNDSGYSMQGLIGGKKSGKQTENRHEAVEMQGGHVEPVELMGTQPDSTVRARELG
ncbi:hypothetical protein COCSADRAFT_192727 [Bipolaris sorokiniana ND90Pr]|uniref:Mid2 domain-containing protein n=1 Tax=Cochliobolus sativus (strain ND90Pr / ATCC 201652) TaxID=665912 RepID=M2SUZ1_COCSN|nr:uncharacterized protein COCSADRAFT_192727 [Bipolaris sorokiniana ND90Pr]EMD60896.1 hypothetical protein COCSADRAFT_192727 [Bipolaris sorokiniana ND90Pr]